jgi:hypothetical protein
MRRISASVAAALVALRFGIACAGRQCVGGLRSWGRGFTWRSVRSNGRLPTLSTSLNSVSARLNSASAGALKPRLKLRTRPVEAAGVLDLDQRSVHHEVPRGNDQPERVTWALGQRPRAPPHSICAVHRPANVPASCRRGSKCTPSCRVRRSRQSSSASGRDRMTAARGCGEDYNDTIIRLVKEEVEP